MLIDESDSPRLLFGRYAYFRLELFDTTIYVQKLGLLYIKTAITGGRIKPATLPVGAAPTTSSFST